MISTEVSHSHSRPPGMPERPAAAPRVPHLPGRTILNFWVDAALAIAFIILAWLVGVTRFVFPFGPEAYSYSLWGRSVDDWRNAEFITFCVFASLVVLHVTLHWNWLCSITNTHIFRKSAGRDDGSRTLLGVGMLIGIFHALAIGLLLAKFLITSNAH